MPQLQLPIFPVGSTSITPEIAVHRRDGQVVYLVGHFQAFVHDVSDLASFRQFTTQLIINGMASQTQISKAFGIPLITVKRCCKKYRERGSGAFHAPSLKRHGQKLTPERLARAQVLLDEGKRVPAIGAELGVLQSTIHKAIGDNRLRRPEKKSAATGAPEVAQQQRAEENPAILPETPEHDAERRERAPDDAEGEVNESIVTRKSDRSVADSQTLMGAATGRTLDRVAAAMGLLDEAALEFEAADDIPQGGVLCALPALITLGLLRHSRSAFSLPKGFYPIETIFLVIAFLALARIRSLEALRYLPPGEWGKLLGLDRIPEVKTLREKLSVLCDEAGRAQRWSGELAKEWMEATAPDAAGTLYIDGHVRVYHGKLTKLPRRHVAREKLCLRGTTDYWVNAMDGQPFFVVTKPIDPGLIKVLKEEIVPRLESDIPNQPNDEQLKATPRLHRFTLVFDRAGYSPDFFKEMHELRVAILTYHKFPDADWPAEEFKTCTVELINGESVSLELAERGTRFANGLWVREVRERDARAHQTSVLTTDFQRPMARVAAAMFARWCQENFFKYMLEHYGLDRLVEYGLDPLPDTARVVNPAWRRLDGAVRSEVGKQSRDQAAFGALQLQPEPSPEATAAYEQKKGRLLQSIEGRSKAIEELKVQRKKAGKHVLLKDLPEEDRFSQLKTDKKHLVDTIKLVAYRAETILAGIAREKLARSDQDARAWVRGVFQSSVDLRPDPTKGTLTVSIHRQATSAQDAVLLHLCTELTETETLYPGTTMRLVFVPVGSSVPPG